MTVPGARWDVGENLALASEIPDLGYDLDHLVGVDQDWTIDTTAVVQVAMDTVRDAGGGEIVVRNAGRTYIWQGLQMRSKVGLRFVGVPTIQKSTATSSTHIFEFFGAESDTASLMTTDHPLPTPLTVSTASWSGGVATVTTVETHNLLAGDEVGVLSVIPSGYSGVISVTAVNAGAKTFSYAVTTNPGTYSSGGTVNLMPYLCHVVDGSGFAVDDVVMTADDTYAALSGTVQTITAASWDSGTKIATITLSAAVAAVTDAFIVSGANSSGPGSFNGVFSILTKSGSTLTYKLRANPGTWTSAGTAQYLIGQTLELARVTGVTGNEVRLDHALTRSYATASNARLVKLNAVERTYLTGKVRLVIPKLPSGSAGGGIFWNFAYESDADQVDVYGPSDDAAFAISRSAKIRLTRWGAFEGQRFGLGGYAYGVSIIASAHDIRVSNGFAYKIRENNCGGGARDIVFENNQGTWIYNNFFNTHGQGCGRVRIADNHVVLAPGQSLGFDVGDSAGLAGDFDIDILDNEIYGSGRSAIQIQGHSDGTKNCRRIRVAGNRFDKPVTAHGVFAKFVDDIVIEDNVYRGGGVVGQAMVYLLNANDAEVRDNRGRGNGSDYGVYWQNVTGLSVSGNNLKNFASNNLRGLTSTDVTLGPNVMDDTDVLLEGTETLVGSESLAGALRATLGDTDVTPDPVYRYHAWTISQVRTVNAPTNTKRVVGQRITFDITNTALIPVTPVWDAAFVLGAPFRLKAA